MTKVTVYSNLSEVELFVNGKSLGKQESKDKFFYFQVPNYGRSEMVAVAGECKDESVINKLDSFNEVYRLKEKGAILNWFDITAPEGYFSLNDKMSAIMQNEAGRAVLSGLMAHMTLGMGDGMMSGFEMSESLMKMMSGFTLIRLASLMGTAGGVNITKEQLLAINAQLNQIKM